jgi:NADH dehydrogenase
VAAANVSALLHNSDPLKTFDYKPIGGLASLGQRQAVAQIGPIHLSGLPAWFAWRGIYLAKLPSLGDKVLVLLDWITDLFAPVDIAQLPVSRASRLFRLEGSQATPGTAQPTQPAGTPS